VTIEKIVFAVQNNNTQLRIQNIDAIGQVLHEPDIVTIDNSSFILDYKAPESAVTYHELMTVLKR